MQKSSISTSSTEDKSTFTMQEVWSTPHACLGQHGSAQQATHMKGLKLLTVPSHKFGSEPREEGHMVWSTAFISNSLQSRQKNSPNHHSPVQAYVCEYRRTNTHTRRHRSLQRPVECYKLSVVEDKRVWRVV
ncbi:hypothetical protein AOLI_G00301750 [Acnodon oligacanthus]